MYVWVYGCVYVCMLAIPGKMAKPNWMTFLRKP